MPKALPGKSELKQAVKDALVETLREQRGLLEEVFAEVLEDFALNEAIREGRDSLPTSRAEVERALNRSKLPPRRGK